MATKTCSYLGGTAEYNVATNSPFIIRNPNGLTLTNKKTSEVSSDTIISGTGNTTYSIVLSSNTTNESYIYQLFSKVNSDDCTNQNYDYITVYSKFCNYLYFNSNNNVGCEIENKNDFYETKSNYYVVINNDKSVYLKIKITETSDSYIQFDININDSDEIKTLKEEIISFLGTDENVEHPYYYIDDGDYYFYIQLENCSSNTTYTYTNDSNTYVKKLIIEITEKTE